MATTAASFGCADGCLPEWIHDGECDEQCNTVTCSWDGTDCAHGHTECYAEPKGSDYRGAVSRTEKGFVCQSWAEQFPHQHARTHQNFPRAGLGGHNHCRNPDGEMSPYCFTTDPVMRWDYCDVGPPTLRGCAQHARARARRDGDDGGGDGDDDDGGGDDDDGGGGDGDGDDDGDDGGDDDDGGGGGGDDDDNGPMPDRPAAMSFVPGAGALDLASGVHAEATMAEAIVKGASLAAPVAAIFVAICARQAARGARAP